MEVKDEDMEIKDESLENEGDKPKKYRGEQFFYLLSDDEVKQFGEDDYITDITKYYYSSDKLRVGPDQVFEWRRRCQYCKNGSVLIKLFGGAENRSDSNYKPEKIDKDKIFRSRNHDDFKKLLSEEDAKLFQAEDYISRIVTYVYDASGRLEGIKKGSYDWNRPCPHCEYGYETIKTFGGESANTFIELEKLVRLENPTEPDKSIEPDKSGEVES